MAKTVRILACALVLGLLGVREVAGGGYELEVGGARLLGTALAGRAALAEDPSTIFFNSAGMTRLPQTTLTLGLGLLPLTARFVDAGSTDLTGGPMTGPTSEDGGPTALVPHLYVTTPLGKSVVAGIGVNAPFGLSTNYGERWVGRYFATETKLTILNVNPAVAVRLGERWSVGAGFAAQYAKATVANMIDFGSLGLPIGLTPQGSDGRLKVTGDDLDFGYNVGVLFEPLPTTRIGASYRSQISHNLRGKANFTVPPEAQPLTLGGALFADTGASAPLTTPESISLSAYHELTPRWALVGDVSWMRWSRQRELVIRFDNPNQPTFVLPTNWDDPWRFSVGVIFRPDEQWTLRGGFAYDQTPIPDRFREPRIPDEERFWFALGVSYKLSDRWTFDASYAYLLLPDASIDVRSPIQGRLVGEVEWTVHVVVVGMTIRF